MLVVFFWVLVGAAGFISVLVGGGRYFWDSGW